MHKNKAQILITVFSVRKKDHWMDQTRNCRTRKATPDRLKSASYNDILPKYQKRFLIFLCHREGLTDEVNDDSEQVYRNIKQVLNNFQSKKRSQGLSEIPQIKSSPLKDQKEKEEFYGIQHSLQNENSKAKAYGS